MVLALTKNLCKPLAISLFAEIFLRKHTKAGDFFEYAGAILPVVMSLQSCEQCSVCCDADRVYNFRDPLDHCAG